MEPAQQRGYIILGLLKDIHLSGPIERFRGTAGRNNLIDALLQQQIVGGNRELAEELADRAEVVEVAEGQAIISQGGDDDEIPETVFGCGPAGTLSLCGCGWGANCTVPDE